MSTRMSAHMSTHMSAHGRAALERQCTGDGYQATAEFFSPRCIDMCVDVRLGTCKDVWIGLWGSYMGIDV